MKMYDVIQSHLQVGIVTPEPVSMKLLSIQYVDMLPECPSLQLLHL
jgi:hypothetical protein